MYEKILFEGELTVDDSLEIMKLRLSGLVTKQQGTLKVYNSIYQLVFDRNWVEKELQNMRPYAEAFAAWEASGRDAAHLLCGDDLGFAKAWANGRSLSDKDYQFLVASQEMELIQAQQRTEIALLQEKGAQQNLVKAQRKVKRSARLGFASIIAGLMIGAIPIIFTSESLAILLNNFALEIYYAGNLQTAEKLYDLALLIKPGYPEALYTQGRIYEDLQDFNSAYNNYENAKDQKFPQAYSELARLYILDKKYSRAVAILSDGLKLPLTDRQKYTMLKNLGWARLELARQGKATYEQAEVPLRQAIALTLKYEYGSPHCLLAQVLEGKAVKSESLGQWRKCVEFGDPEHPDERNWIKDAQKRVQPNVAN